ncbi:hypothetical protein BJY27_010424 [Streptomyces rapamycinicus]|uniref:Uncharacterized protein n=1 Tax=Streptomyces rapamycinicus TaxID=1226757 RepID=A0ABR6M436_9ACTN|nr:hypothetical protein [Streptomyces rapamycinicus]
MTGTVRQPLCTAAPSHASAAVSAHGTPPL